MGIVYSKKLILPETKLIEADICASLTPPTPNNLHFRRWETWQANTLVGYIDRLWPTFFPNNLLQWERLVQNYVPGFYDLTPLSRQPCTLQLQIDHSGLELKDKWWVAALKSATSANQCRGTKKFSLAYPTQCQRVKIYGNNNH